MSNTPKRILVLGAGGMLGHMAVRVLGETFEVFGTTRGDKNSLPMLAKFLTKEQWLTGIDVLNDQQLEEVFALVKPDAVINCVGLIKQKMDSGSYIQSIEINALLPHKLYELSNKHGAKLIQISTDCVFTCDEGINNQSDTPNAADLYGRTKYLGEVNYGSALTLRTSIVGRQISGQESFFEWILGQKGNVASGYRNAIYTGLTTFALSRVISEILSSNFSLSGLWQVASQPISKFELMTKLNETLALNIDIQENIDFQCDRRLDGTPFLLETRIHVPSWDEMVQQFSQDQINYQTTHEVN
jgi:dTDP-4-dehydrorhamnose reductase